MIVYRTPAAEQEWSVEPWATDFFYFGLKNQEINPVKTYFLDLTLSSRASLVGAIHEGVTPTSLV
jgi:hypothetical protein